MQIKSTVILTREPADNRPLLDRLNESGIPVIEYPCILTRMIPYEKSASIDGYELSDFFDIGIYQSPWRCRYGFGI